MSRWSFLAVLLLVAMSLNAQSSKPRYLPKPNHMCKATLADGAKYEVWDRILVTEANGGLPICQCGPTASRARENINGDRKTPPPTDGRCMRIPSN